MYGTTVHQDFELLYLIQSSNKKWSWLILTVVTYFEVVWGSRNNSLQERLPWLVDGCLNNFLRQNRLYCAFAFTKFSVLCKRFNILCTNSSPRFQLLSELLRSISKSTLWSQYFFLKMAARLGNSRVIF